MVNSLYLLYIVPLPIKIPLWRMVQGLRINSIRMETLSKSHYEIGSLSLVVFPPDKITKTYFITTSFPDQLKSYLQNHLYWP